MGFIHVCIAVFWLSLVDLFHPSGDLEDGDAARTRAHVLVHLRVAQVQRRFFGRAGAWELKRTSRMPAARKGASSSTSDPFLAVPVAMGGGQTRSQGKSNAKGMGMRREWAGDRREGTRNTHDSAGASGMDVETRQCVQRMRMITTRESENKGRGGSERLEDGDVPYTTAQRAYAHSRSLSPDSTFPSSFRCSYVPPLPLVLRCGVDSASCVDATERRQRRGGACLRVELVGRAAPMRTYTVRRTRYFFSGRGTERWP